MNNNSKEQQKAEVINNNLKYTDEHYSMDLTINGKQINMDVMVCGRRVENHIEGKTDIWNSLTIEEKIAIEDEIENYFDY